MQLKKYGDFFSTESSGRCGVVQAPDEVVATSWWELSGLPGARALSPKCKVAKCFFLFFFFLYSCLVSLHILCLNRLILGQLF